MILTLIRFFQEKYESGMFELVDTRKQQSNKEVVWQKVFYVFWKYKNNKINCIEIQNTFNFFKGIKIQNRICILNTCIWNTAHPWLSAILIAG